LFGGGGGSTDTLKTADEIGLAECKAWAAQNQPTVASAVVCGAADVLAVFVGNARRTIGSSHPTLEHCVSEPPAKLTGESSMLGDPALAQPAIFWVMGPQLVVLDDWPSRQPADPRCHGGPCLDPVDSLPRQL
jgi:hypothetical protein